MSQSRRDRASTHQRVLAEQQAAQRRRERRLLAGVVGAIVVVLVAAGIGFQAWRTHRAPDAGTLTPGPSVPVTIVDGQPVSWGSPGAPVTVDLYEDFHCPHCAEFEEEYGQVLADAQAAGTIRLRIFPMSFIDAGSTAAANAFACAAEAGFGESYYTGLFANHTLDWSDSQLVQLAERAHGSPVPAEFSTCVSQRSHAGWVDSINTAAATAGVDGTPTMFLDGSRIDIEALNPDSLTTKIEEAARP
ncbi:MAG TPA: thioredoxin domain-containing protein [Microlunatus sp.]